MIVPSGLPAMTLQETLKAQKLQRAADEATAQVAEYTNQDRRDVVVGHRMALTLFFAPLVLFTVLIWAWFDALIVGGGIGLGAGMLMGGIAWGLAGEMSTEDQIKRDNARKYVRATQGALDDFMTELAYRAAHQDNDQPALSLDSPEADELLAFARGNFSADTPIRLPDGRTTTGGELNAAVVAARIKRLQVENDGLRAQRREATAAVGRLQAIIDRCCSGPH